MKYVKYRWGSLNRIWMHVCWSAFDVGLCVIDVCSICDLIEAMLVFKGKAVMLVFKWKVLQLQWLIENMYEIYQNMYHSYDIVPGYELCICMRHSQNCSISCWRCSSVTFRLGCSTCHFCRLAPLAAGRSRNHAWSADKGLLDLCVHVFLELLSDTWVTLILRLLISCT